MNVVEMNGLCKYYGRQAAVDHLNMTVPEGCIYGFIGRNGAGKSTALKMLCSLAKADQGEIRVFGKLPADRIAGRRIGHLIEEPGLYPHFSAHENLYLQAQCLGLTDRESSIQEILALVGLEQAGKKRVRNFSMGMKQRLGLGMALLGNPDLLILDEPINGLDPEGIREIRELLLHLNRERHITVLISSHILGELEKLATHYGIIKDGHMVKELKAQDLLEECRDYLLVRVDEPKQAAALLEETLGLHQYEVHPGGELRIFGCEDGEAVSRTFTEQKLAVKELYLHRQDLEQYFLELMEK